VKRLWIAGGAGAALEVWAVAHALGREVAGFVLLPDETLAFDPEGLAVREEPGFLRETDPKLDEPVLAIGNPLLRARAARKYAAMGFAFATLVHPTAIRGPHVTLGEGSVVMAAAVIETHVTVGAHALINVQASLGHECWLGACCSVGPGVHLAGRVRIGERCDLGVGVVARPGVKLGDDLVVGAGAVLVSDHAGPGVLMGNPARPRAPRTA
jgi:sugar O-acyltransferase (sialic acid O-acetyltransferase NeuD family)